MREPIVSHELNPKGGERIDVSSLFIVALGLRRVVGQPAAMVALLGGRLPTGKKFSADHLGVRRQQIEPLAVTIFRRLIQCQFRKSRVEVDVAGERLAGRAHQWVEDVIADACESPEANQIAATLLRSISADRCMKGMVFGKSELLPDLRKRSRGIALTANVFLVRSAVVVKIEF